MARKAKNSEDKSLELKKKKTLMNTIVKDITKVDNEDSLSHVESFLEGKGKYSFLFDRSNKDGDSSNIELTILENMHCIVGKTVTVGAGGVDKSFLTRKNLSNYVDISTDSLYRHTKDIEANCKKALAICTASHSPYRNFNGDFPSGTNRDDYLVWIRSKMNSSMQSVTIDDDDDDAVPNGEDEKTSSDDDDKKTGTGKDVTDIKENY